jgi:hypothetical protein
MLDKETGSLLHLCWDRYRWALGAMGADPVGAEAGPSWFWAALEEL